MWRFQRNQRRHLCNLQPFYSEIHSHPVNSLHKMNWTATFCQCDKNPLWTKAFESHPTLRVHAWRGRPLTGLCCATARHGIPPLFFSLSRSIFWTVLKEAWTLTSMWGIFCNSLIRSTHQTFKYFINRSFCNQSFIHKFAGWALTANHIMFTNSWSSTCYAFAFLLAMNASCPRTPRFAHKTPLPLLPVLTNRTSMAKLAKIPPFVVLADFMNHDVGPPPL